MSQITYYKVNIGKCKIMWPKVKTILPYVYLFSYGGGSGGVRAEVHAECHGTVVFNGKKLES
jgi:hypothetical protein